MPRIKFIEMKFISKTTVPLLLLIILLSLSSCFSSKVNKKYYEIYYSSAKLKKKALPYIIRVKRFDIDKIYDRYNVVNRTSAHELVYSKSQFWAVKPERMVTDLVTNQLKFQGIFQEVTTRFEKVPDYILTGRILVLDNLKSGEDVFARLSIELAIHDFKTNKVIISYKFEKRKEVLNKGMVYVAREMSEILKEEVNKFLLEAYEKLSNE